MTKEVVEALKSYRLIADKEREDRIIKLGRERLFEQAMNSHSYFNLLLFTLSFISWKTWLSQFATFAMGVTLVYRASYFYDISGLMQSLTAVLFISVIFFLEELFKSFTTGMWELEQTFKYDLRQHTMVKLLIFGLVDMILILILSLLTNSLTSQPLLNLLLYLLVPYNIICLVLFSLLTAWRRHIQPYALWLSTAFLVMLAFIITNIFNIYHLELHHWLLAYVLTALPLFYILHRQLQKIIREEVF